MEKEKIKSERYVYSDECPKCKKLIKGFSESHLKYNLKIHLGTHEKNGK